MGGQGEAAASYYCKVFECSHPSSAGPSQGLDSNKHPEVGALGRARGLGAAGQSEQTPRASLRFSHPADGKDVTHFTPHLGRFLPAGQLQRLRGLPFFAISPPKSIRLHARILR